MSNKESIAEARPVIAQDNQFVVKIRNSGNLNCDGCCSGSCSGCACNSCDVTQINPEKVIANNIK